MTPRLGAASVTLLAALLTSCSASDVVVLGQGSGAGVEAVARPSAKTTEAGSITAAAEPAPRPTAPATPRPTAPATPRPIVPRPTTAAFDAAPSPTAARPSAAPPTTLLGTVPARLDQLPGTPGPRPVGLRINPTGIAGPIQPVGVAPDTGELAVPPVAGVVGWYQYGPSPGQLGSAVLAGHVDWHGAMGVFFTLGQVEAGAVISITYDDGGTKAFTVVERRLVLKPELPVESVFARAGPPSLVLVTCGGDFDRSRRRYRSNVVVVATPLP
jgi:hypothetical protein